MTPRLKEELGWDQTPCGSLPSSGGSAWLLTELGPLEGSPLFQPNPWHPQRPPCRTASSSGLEAMVGPALGLLVTSSLACGHCLWA